MLEELYDPKFTRKYHLWPCTVH